MLAPAWVSLELRGVGKRRSKEMRERLGKAYRLGMAALKGEAKRL